jgi:hypothetical protein
MDTHRSDDVVRSEALAVDVDYHEIGFVSAASPQAS